MLQSKVAMHFETHHLSSLIGSRICHDLISPIGAITNGMELLTLSGVSSGPEMSLIADSVDSAGARIRFFRVAYGVAGKDWLNAGEVTGILRDLAQAGRVQMIWDVPGDVARADVQLAFLALQCVETALAYGGTARVTRKDDQWHVTAQSPRLQHMPELWADLTRDTRQITITPALVQFALLPGIARANERQLRVALTETQVTVSF